MNFTFASIVATINSRLQLINDFKNVLFHSTYQRIVDLMGFTGEKIAYEGEYYYREASWKNALNRSSLVNQSYPLSYIPYRKIGAAGTLDLTGSSSFSTSYTWAGSDVFINKYAQITDTTGKLFCYAVANSTYYHGTVGNFTVNVKQGIPKTFLYTAIGASKETVTIFDDSTDNDIYEVNIVDVNGTVLYPVTILTANQDPFFINNLVDYYCSIGNTPDFSAITFTFGDDIYTKKLTSGQLVQIKYVQTLGASGNIQGINSISTIVVPFVDSQGNQVTLYVRNPVEITDGSDYESLESIRNNGRRLFFAGYRLANNEDWITVLNDTGIILKSKVWTKADLGLPAVGLDQNLVYISAVSTSGKALTTAEQADIIYNTLYPLKCPTDVISFQVLQKLYVRFDCNITANTVPQAQIQSEVNAELEVYDISAMDFAQNIYFSNYTKEIDLAPNVKHHSSTAYYVEKTDNTGALFDIFKYSYTLMPTKSSDPYYPSTSPYYEADATKQILLIPGEFEIWIKRKVSDVWQPPVKVAKDNTTNNIKGLRYIATNDVTLAAVDPTVNDDGTGGNYVGKIWKNTVSGAYFDCLGNATGAAVWEDLKATSAGLPTVNTDVTQNFTVGSVWYDPVTGNYYQCQDNSNGAAVWQIRNNISGFGDGSASLPNDFRSFTWAMTGDSVSYTTNLISYELRTIIDDPSTYGVLNPSTTDPLGFIVYLSYRMQDGNGLQTEDIRLGGFAQILDFDSTLNTFAISY